MKFKKIAAVLLCVTTMASAPYVPVLTDTLQSFSISAEAADTYVKQFTVDMLTYSVYKTSSGSQYVVVSGSNTNVTNVNIPATITYSGTTYPIKKIASGAFQNKKRLATVDLSVAKNLTEISSNAFASSSVKTVVIGSSVTIQSNAFYNTTSLTTLTFQSGATKATIAANAFSYSGLTTLNCYAPEIIIKSNAFGSVDPSKGPSNSKLTTVYFGSNTKKITLGAGVFSHMQKLTSVKIDNTSATVSLGSGVFAGSTVSTVKLPNTLTSIPDSTFSGCAKLKTFTIPSNVTTIGSYAFSESGLTGTVTIGAKVTSIGTYAFYNLQNTKAFSVSTSNAYYKSGSDNALYTKNGDTLIVYPCAKTATTYTLTSKYIQEGAFGSNSYLKTLDLKYMITRPSYYGNFPNLENIIIPEGDARQSGKVIFERYDSLIKSNKFYKINNQEILTYTSDGMPCFMDKYSSYIKQNFENYEYCKFMTDYVKAMTAYVVKNETNDNMTDMEKAVKLHNWILDRTTYDPNEAELFRQLKAGETPDYTLQSKKNHVDASVYLHQRNGVYYTVCEGYAKCYKLLLNEAGIEAYYISGNGNPVGHAWNLVNINGIFYHVDACWDDENYDAGAYKYDNFMKSDVQFNGDGHSTYQWAAEEDPHGYLNEQNSNSNISYGYLGDVKYNEQVRGLVDSNDVTYLQSLVNAVAIPARERAYGDMDFDGDLDNNDVSMLKEYLSKYKKSYGSAWKWRLSSLENVQQLSDVCVANGATAKTTIVSDNNIVKYEWYYKNANMSSFAKTTSFTGKTYSVAMNSTRSGRQIYCVLTDDKGNTYQTNIITLSMK